jgi:hypothetical protein
MKFLLVVNFESGVVDTPMEESWPGPGSPRS